MRTAPLAQDSGGKVGTVSSTPGVKVHQFRLDEAGRGGTGCPSYLSMTTAAYVIVSGSLTAAQFIGDGSGPINVGAASTDRNTSGPTAVSGTGQSSLRKAASTAPQPARG